MEEYESDFTEYTNKKYKCHICEKQNEENDTTQYKFKQVCRNCIIFFKNTTIFYGNMKAWKQPKTITDIKGYSLNNINDDKYPE